MAVFHWPEIIMTISLPASHARGTVTHISLHAHCLVRVLFQQTDTKLIPEGFKCIPLQIALNEISLNCKTWKIHQRAKGGWLCEAVHTSCLHTNQHWCLLSALILVNTDVYLKKWSDRCMIEVLKSRHSQWLPSSLLISQGCCDSPHAFLSWHYVHRLSFISCRFFLVSFPWCDVPFASYTVNCMMLSTVRNNHLIIIHRGRNLFFFIKEYHFLGRTCLILSSKHQLHMDFATFSKTLL